MLAKSFAMIHSSQNLSNEELAIRMRTIEENKDMLGTKTVGESTLDADFTLFELKRALIGVKNTSPGRDGICYKMIEGMSDVAKNVILVSYDKIWEQGKLPTGWKHSVIVPIGKPGKDKTDVKSYRPTALMSNLCKLMEKMIAKKLLYNLESRGLITPYQSGLCKGRTALDPVVCLENEVHKAQVNKEFVLAAFFDIEKAYDMLLKEGLLIKLNKMEISGKMFNWIKDF